MGNPLRSQGARQFVFNFGVDGDIFVRELDTDTRLLVALGPLRGDPHNATGYRQFSRLIHQSEQQKNLIL